MCIALVLLICASPTALAEIPKHELDAARALANAGFERYTAGDYSTAFERFRNAEAIFHAPPHLLYMARCKAALGELLEARQHYERLAAEQLKADQPAEFGTAQQEARAELASLVERIPSLTIIVSGPEATQVRLTIDDAAVDAAAQPFGIDPGEHRIAASADGYFAEERTVQLAEGAASTVELVLRSTSADPEPTGGSAGGQSLLPPIVVMSIGGVGLLIGAISGAIALDNAGELKDSCPDRTQCSSKNEELEDTARAAGTASTISFVIGGVGVGGGLLWLLLTMNGDDAPADAAVQPFADGSQMGLRVAF